MSEFDQAAVFVEWLCSQGITLDDGTDAMLIGRLSAYIAGDRASSVSIEDLNGLAYQFQFDLPEGALAHLQTLLKEMNPFEARSPLLENDPMSQIRVPIQPFDDTLRTKIAKAIMKAHDEASQLPGGVDVDPDACYRAADEVLAVLVGELLGVRVTLAPQKIIGNGTLVIDRDEAPASKAPALPA